MLEKKFFSTEELIKNIRKKGIIIYDEIEVSNILKNENYYVLSGYKTLFLDDEKNYKPNTNFMDIYKLSQ